MKTITVKTSNEYQVVIGCGLQANLGKYLASLGKTGRVAVISDTNVWPLYGDQISTTLKQSGFETIHYVFPAGESSKNAQTYLEILNFFAENKLVRTDCVIALGGGVVGDITGFAAATYLRGISYIQIPTTLLAMVDSSVGGKTAIDLPVGKNLVGAFYQPSLVLCDISALNTLPCDIFRDGCAEIIKYGVLYDKTLFEHLAEHGINFDREYVITRCIELKRDVVAEDEFDRGSRQKLNLGHTFGHSIEAQSNFQISHGQAVAIGIDIVSKAAYKLGICHVSTYEHIHSILDKFSLPTISAYSANEIYSAALSDKKRAGSTVNLIVPKSIGNCILYPTPISELLFFIKAGL